MSDSFESGDTTVSIRLLWPFLRLTGANPKMIPTLAREGIDPASIANPDTRLRSSVAMRLLERTVANTGDPTLGLRAGQGFEQGDMDALEYAFRTCSTLREGILCGSRYMRLINGGAEGQLLEDGKHAIWRFKQIDPNPQPPAANDFILSFTLQLVRRYVASSEGLLEVHFMHEEPTSAEAYARFFEARVRMGMPDNAMIMERSVLNAPMLHANPGLHDACAGHAAEMLRRLEEQLDKGVAGLVRRILISRMTEGDTSMVAIAQELAMSVATLRRRLDDDGTSHKRLLDEVRHELALKYLREPRLSISEVAFLLGFSHVTAFYKAFRRWEDGATPAEYRASGQPGNSNAS